MDVSVEHGQHLGRLLKNGSHFGALVNEAILRIFLEPEGTVQVLLVYEVMQKH